MTRLGTAWDSAIGKKIAMAGSGIILVGFLISHMISNVLVFVNPQHLDDYSVWLRSFGPLLWVARLGLLAAVTVHILAAWQLTRRAHGARPVKYAKHEHFVSNYATRTMRWGGVLLLSFIVFHILHLTLGQFHPDYREGEVGHNLITGLQVTPVAIFYLLAMIALGGHLIHGIWSALQTLGANHPAWNSTRNMIAIGIGFIIAAGLASIPLAALFGWLQ